ncbi:MAG: hypothetical protein JWN43_278 [Gammaproteobacteria bacterium]|nr:hypothetical protein [Gammaproteobacteria bacterium]
MTVNASVASASAVSPTLEFHIHGHKKGTQAGSGAASSASSSAQGQATTQGLLSGLLQSLEQVIGVSLTSSTSAAAGLTAATGTAATGTVAAANAASTPVASSGTATVAQNAAQDVQSFLHSLFQALKADGLGGSTTSAGGPSAATAATGSTPSNTGIGASGGAGQYQGSLASSLQTLIQQLGSNGAPSASTANLSDSFNTMMQGVNGSAATANAGDPSTGSNPQSQASLQNFLNKLLQTVQSGGSHSLSSVGVNVDAKV